MRLLITGATGFVGKALIEAACQAGFNVTALVRKESVDLPAAVSQIAVGDFAAIAKFSKSPVTANNEKLSNSTFKNMDVTDTASGPTLTHSEDKLLSAMHGIDMVIHTAARTHVMNEKHSDPAEIYQQINVTFTKRLAEAAAKAGLKRFVFLSSIKVNGESTTPIPTFPHQGGSSNSSSRSPHGEEGWGEGAGKPFTETDIPNPQDPYAVSKWQAEQKLTAIGQNSGMEIVILRAPLIYGPGVKGNFASLIKLMNKGIPLPFGSVKNQRSLLALDNLVSAILLVSSHPAASHQTYLVADEKAVSTTQLLNAMAAAQGKKACLLPVSVNLMKALAKLIGKQSIANRLFGSLQVDTTKIKQQLGWQPVTTMHQQLKKMFLDFDERF